MRTNTIAWVAGIIILLVLIFLLFGNRLSSNQNSALVSPTPTASFNSASPSESATPSPTESTTPLPSVSPRVMTTHTPSPSASATQTP